MMTWRVRDSSNRAIATFDARVTGQVGVGANTVIGFCNLAVPQGRVVVLRWFEYSFSPVFNLDPSVEYGSEYSSTIYVGPPTVVAAGPVVQQQGTAQPGYSGMLLGQRCSREPTYIIADEGETLSLIVRTTAALPVLHTHFKMRFYGNLLLKTGRPVQFEPGTDAELLRRIARGDAP